MNMPRAARGRVPLLMPCHASRGVSETMLPPGQDPAQEEAHQRGAQRPVPRPRPSAVLKGERVERARDTAVPGSPDNRGARAGRYRRQLAGAAYIGAGHGRPGSAVPVQGEGLRPGGVSHGPHIGGRAGCDPSKRAGCGAGRNGPRGAVPVRDERAGRAVAGLWVPKTYATRRYS
jgi:hypothetical protein